MLTSIGGSIMLKGGGSFLLGDVTHMQAYIELGDIMRDFWGQHGVFARAALSDEQVKLRHTMIIMIP